MARFHVNSGKIDFNYDQPERNYKYCNVFETFEEAFVEWKVNRSYAFNEILYQTDNDEWFDITPTENK
jgi:hypothetical protein